MHKGEKTSGNVEEILGQANTQSSPKKSALLTSRLSQIFRLLPSPSHTINTCNSASAFKSRATYTIKVILEYIHHFN